MTLSDHICDDILCILTTVGWYVSQTILFRQASIIGSVAAIRTWTRRHYGLSSHDVGECQLHVEVSILLPAPATSDRAIAVG